MASTYLLALVSQGTMVTDVNSVSYQSVALQYGWALMMLLLLASYMSGLKGQYCHDQSRPSTGHGIDALV